MKIWTPRFFSLFGVNQVYFKSGVESIGRSKSRKLSVPLDLGRYNTSCLIRQIPQNRVRRPGSCPMAKPALDRWIDRYVARIRLGEFLQRAAETGAAFLFAFGATVLVVKLLIPQAWPNVLWGGLGLIPALGLAWWLSRR